MLNINYSLVLAEISNSYGDGNGRHGHVANIPHLLDLYSNRIPAPGRPPAPESRKSLRNIVTRSYIRLPERDFCFACEWGMVLDSFLFYREDEEVERLNKSPLLLWWSPNQRGLMIVFSGARSTSSVCWSTSWAPVICDWGMILDLFYLTERLKNEEFNESPKLLCLSLNQRGLDRSCSRKSHSLYLSTLWMTMPWWAPQSSRVVCGCGHNRGR